MAEAATKLPVKTEEKEAGRRLAPHPWRPFEGLRQEIDRLFEDFDRDVWTAPFRHLFLDVEPFHRRVAISGVTPAVDISETDKAYEITVDVPGMDEKDIEVRVANGGLTIKGESHEEKEEKKKDFFLHERRHGSFERWFRMPEGIETDKVEATFRKGVLTVTLPKTPEAQKAEKKITVKAA
jgi:HSP20 family protein